MKYTNNCVKLVKEFEGLYLEAYYCASNVLTIGYGHTKNVTPKMCINEAKAELLLKQDLNEMEVYVNYYIEKYKFKLNQNQFDALVSFTFNCGPGNLNKVLNACKKVSDIPNQMMKRVYSKQGVLLNGLVRRRKAEVALFNTKVKKGGDIMFDTIKKGMKNNESVGIWQILRGLKVDKEFGAKTYTDVINFQRNNGLKIDGVVGPDTWTKLLTEKGYLK